MPSETPVLPQPTEKPHHYTYLKEFRTQQCPLFLQHKCNQHRPFTCFHWHFMNQRRRRPVRRREGAFSYSPDVYCTKYDETTGICPEGDDCPYLHRTAGDTERRYHLRYYKTCTCVYETDTRGQCVKNGQHCAFAHGAQDLRPPVYDVRELQALEALEKQGQAANVADSPLGTSLEKDRIINEDPKWNDTNYVLANYKTDQCKRPPRLCRQGYACPSYHNSRDKRRSPKKIKYRSTPCPNVKHGDDWGDPAQCDSGENCPYCHTRTEQQFHPEIYKSTKCNDMVQTGYCPRGPFCAFAHVEQEMTTQRELSAASDNSLAAFVTNALPDTIEDKENHIDDQNEDKNLETRNENNNGQGILPTNSNGSMFFQTEESPKASSSFSGVPNFPEPIGKGRTSSVSSSNASDYSFCYQRAPGSEREDTQTKLRQQILAIENDHTLDQAEKSKRTQNLLLLHNLNSGNGALSPSLGSSPGSATQASNMSSNMSPHAPSFYPPGDIVDSVIGNALEEDLNLADLHLKGENDNDTNSVCSSLSTGFPSSGSYLGATSVPVTIPSSSGCYPRNSLGSLSQSPGSSPLGSLGPTFIPQHVSQEQKQEQQLQEAAAAFLSQPNPGKFSAPGFSEFTSSSMSPRNNSISQSPMVGSGSISSSPFVVNGYGDVTRLREELAANKAKLSQWEDGISQARNACEAWKKEAEDSNRRTKTAEEERLQAVKQRDEALQQLSNMKRDAELQRGNSVLKALYKGKELETLPLPQLQQLQQQLRLEMELIEKAIIKSATVKCVVCRDRNRSIRVLPCNHYVLCDLCAAKSSECPYCHAQITQRNPANLVF